MSKVQNTDAPASSEYAAANAACRLAFEEEDGYGHPDSNPQRYRIFRDGFFAAWNLARAAAAIAQEKTP